MAAIQSLFDNTPVRSDFKIPEMPLPDSARVIIVGGGIAGASVAYHFAQAGWKDVYVLEQNSVGSGTTWHSAGQVGQLRSSSAQTKVNKASVELYSRLHQETGHDPGWLTCGGLQLATSQERMLQLHRNAAMADLFGVESEVISADECVKYWPMLRTNDLVGAVYLPGDGRVLPRECTIALAKAAINKGVKFIENVTVKRLIDESLHRSTGSRRITGVETSQGIVSADWVVLTGNMWMRQLAMTAGIDIPVYPCEHHYVITKPIEGVTRNAPCTRDPDAGLYFRALDDGGLKLGAFKERSKPWKIGDSVPGDFAFSLLEPDWPDFAEPFRDHMHRIQGITRADVVKFINGPEAFTPDNNFIMGQPSVTEGLFVLGGWNSAGIACAGGAGKYAVQWIESGGMTIDLSSVDLRRFLPFQNKRVYLQERVSEVLGLHYQMSWPGRQMETARGIRSSGLREIHVENNACFGETAGWERPLYFAPDGMEPKTEYSFVRQNWHDWVCNEVLACRRNVAIMDQSTFAKFLLEGSEALDVLQYLCGANVDTDIGKATYTGMFNSRGAFESDLTVVRLDHQRFYIVTATGQQTKDFDHIAKHLKNRDAELTDVSDFYNVVSVMGKNAPKVFHQLDSNSFRLEHVPYGIVKDVAIGDLNFRAIRISYVGEPGWELHVESGRAAELYRVVETAGRELGIRPIGNHAISTMRIEKGFRAMGHELSVDETPWEAGLGWTIDWNKEFLGKQNLQRQRAQGLDKRLASFVLRDKEATLWGGEPILWNGQIVGHTTSACFSPVAGASVAMGYVRRSSNQTLTKSEIEKGDFEIIHNGKKISAKSGLCAPIEID